MKIKKLSNKQLTMMMLCIAVLTFLFNAHYDWHLFSVYRNIPAIPITEYRQVASVGREGRVEFGCDEQIKGDRQLDYCEWYYVNIPGESWCGGDSGTESLLPGQDYKRCFTDSSLEVTACLSEGYDVSGMQNCAKTYHMRQMTRHYCGNGVCEHESPYTESCSVCEQDCGSCTTTTTIGQCEDPVKMCGGPCPPCEHDFIIWLRLRWMSFLDWLKTVWG
jgi:hypothetical protein